MSLASAGAAEARQEAATTPDYYNLRIGPAAWRFGAEFGVEYNSNIAATGSDTQNDAILRPGASAHMLWPVTERNRLHLDVSGGYSAYLEHSGYSRWFLNPRSESSFDLYVGDMWINVHDRFSISESSYLDPTLYGSGDYSQFQNVAGATVAWDLNKTVLRAGYDHANYVLLSGMTTPDGESDTMYAGAVYAAAAEFQAGLEIGGGLNRYDSVGTNLWYTDASFWNLGPLFEARVTEYVSVRASFGYTTYTPESAMANVFTGLYGQASLNHRLNQYVDYTVSGGRTVNFGYAGGTIDLTFVQAGANWHFLRGCTFCSSITYNHGSYVFGGGERFNWFGPRITLSRAIAKRLSAGLRWQLYVRNSNQEDRSYTANVIGVNLVYHL